MTFYEHLFQKILFLDPPVIEGYVFPLNIEGINGIWSKLPARNKIRNIQATEENVDALIKEVKIFFQGIKDELQDDYFRWYTHPNDDPKTINSHLENSGFFHEYTLIAMTLEPKNYVSPKLNNEFTVREIHDLDEHLDLASKLWDFDWDEEKRKDNYELLKHHKYSYVYVFYNDIPAGVGMYKEIPETNYYYFFRAGVSSNYQKRGAYSHLLDFRVKIAKEKDKEIATIANKKTSFPILKAKGFDELFDIMLYRYSLNA